MSGTGSKPEPTLKENLEKLKKMGNKITTKEMVERAQTMPMADLKTWKIDFGKHKGLNFEEAALEPGYAEWVAAHVDPSKSNPTMQMFVIYLTRRTQKLVDQMENKEGYGGQKESHHMMTEWSKKRGEMDALFDEKIEQGDFDAWTKVTTEETTPEVQKLQEDSAMMQMRMSHIEMLITQIAEKLNIG